MKQVLAITFVLIAAFSVKAQTAEQSIPPLTTKIVREAIKDQRVPFVDSKGKETGAWIFGRDEYVELDIVSKSRDGRAIIVLADVRSGTTAKSIRSKVRANAAITNLPIMEVAGRIRLRFEYTGTDYILVGKIENVSFISRWILD